MMKTADAFVRVDGRDFYKVENSQHLPPFLINVVSACDVWLYLSSSGGITAGRGDANGAVFPYETDDLLHQQAHTGSKTLVRLDGCLWEPFARTTLPRWPVSRSIYKSVRGEGVMMEETNSQLGLRFAYTYETSERFGIVRTASLYNLGEKPVDIDLLDGLENILPCHVDRRLQATSSTLVDAYKASELCPGGVLATYALTTLINDSPNPVEILRANVAWTDKKDAQIALDSQAVDAFARGLPYPFGSSAYGCKGAYFVRYGQTLAPGEGCTHRIVVDHGYDHSALTALAKTLDGPIAQALEEDIQKGRERLFGLVAMADGVQATADERAVHHHYLNTLYNLLRGGVFAQGYSLDAEDFLRFAKARSHALEGDAGFAQKVRACQTVHELKARFGDDPSGLRLALEYLPLSFSRRHGDPSRPWNHFHIRVRDAQGRPVKGYEGNWRDIFQNWEALGQSFPGYLEHMVARFVNASTADGHNPYRIHRDGIDWERPEPDNPFSGLGYWGDHQIVYLLRLLSGLNRHFPQRLRALLRTASFCYANVPYRLKPYEEMLKDAKNTIIFDGERDKRIAALCKEMGFDGQLVQKDGRIYLTGLMEKLLVPLLCKMASLHPQGGVWMNTQRPEWNDANNAIVGIGLSMVTVYHMRAYAAFLLELLEGESDSFGVSAQVAKWLREEARLMAAYLESPERRPRELLDQMGFAFDRYRRQVYHHGFSDVQEVPSQEIHKFLTLCQALLEEAVAKNKNELFTTYNLMHPDGSVEPMRPMLEGQSAAIGAGLVPAKQLPALLEAMDAILGDERYGAHFLYPKRMTTPFWEKNTFRASLDADGRILRRDEGGALHFGPEMTTEQALQGALASSAYTPAQREFLLSTFQALFAHRRFTGRSQVMYKYEGIGCVYWHQNAKLALAVLETALLGGEGAEDAWAAYRRLTGGFLYRKDAAACQAIPIEPYSHTSFDGKSQQPGMTGQVKESVLMRRGELGALVADGILRFEPQLAAGELFEGGTLQFTVCGVPVCYLPGEKNAPRLAVLYAGGKREELPGLALSQEQSREVFLRSGRISAIDVRYG